MLGKRVPGGQSGMTKLELIEALASFPDDTKIVLDGYESGFCDVLGLELVDVAYQPNGSYYDGAYQRVDPDCEAPLKVLSIKAIYQTGMKD
ncbi:hypothetical protein [Pseudomonas serbica]|uniref:hypothetical protein n=1 Tax=Pseudomonas serbica TaxID=2965074 RepID=UPI00237BDC35|nr:hypothetical protein [Pseudomonas serbica]